MDRWVNQKGLCFYCKKKMLRKSSAKLAKNRMLLKTRDHLIPRCDGGMGDSNIVLACLGCNTDKANLNYEEYLFVLELRRLS